MPILNTIFSGLKEGGQATTSIAGELLKTAYNRRVAKRGAAEDLYAGLGGYMGILPNKITPEQRSHGVVQEAKELGRGQDFMGLMPIGMSRQKGKIQSGLKKAGQSALDFLSKKPAIEEFAESLPMAVSNVPAAKPKITHLIPLDKRFIDTFTDVVNTNLGTDFDNPTLARRLHSTFGKGKLTRQELNSYIEEFTNLPEDISMRMAEDIIKFYNQ